MHALLQRTLNDASTREGLCAKGLRFGSSADVMPLCENCSSAKPVRVHAGAVPALCSGYFSMSNIWRARGRGQRRQGGAASALPVPRGLHQRGQAARAHARPVLARPSLGAAELARNSLNLAALLLLRMRKQGMWVLAGS